MDARLLLQAIEEQAGGRVAPLRIVAGVGAILAVAGRPHKVAWVDWDTIAASEGFLDLLRSQDTPRVLRVPPHKPVAVVSLPLPPDAPPPEPVALRRYRIEGVDLVAAYDPLHDVWVVPETLATRPTWIALSQQEG